MVETSKPRNLETSKPRNLETKREAKLEEARAEIRRFHHQLCSTRVLDPACGSGNFLYVTLEHLKRLEGEVLGQLDALGDRRGKLDLAGETVTVQQLRGIELNGRAAALAELVLWIGWLQWQIRTTGSVASVAEPVVHDYGNIEHRDAVLTHDGADVAMDAAGKPITRWDGTSFKKHLVTGEDVPDEAAQTVQWTYRNPRRAAWPEVDFIVGNPPFIGAGPLRASLGNGYAQTLRAAWPEVPESADFVMYWWNHAAALVRAGRVRRFGFITTNSLRQTFNRRVVEAHLSAKDPLTLAFAVPDHPWVDSGAEGAAVRIAMSVGTMQAGEVGRLLSVGEERATGTEEVAVRLDERRGVLHADLRLGANVAGAGALAANGRLSSRGVQLFGTGFILRRAEAAALGLGSVPGLEKHIREYRNGRDLTASPRDVLVIDLFGLSAEQVRERYPAVFQWVFERVKPERDQNNRATYRDNWWVFGEPRKAFRPALIGLSRYIATIETSKHRTFQFLDATVLPDNKLIVIALSDALHHGVLSSQIHVDWSLAAGSWLGIGNDPVYVKTRCFETFPFPSTDTGLTPELADRIRAMAEQLDAHRKARQAAHESVTRTGMYNVLAALRSGQPLSAKDKLMHTHALVSVLQSLHDELDAAVLQAYGWSDLGTVPWADEAARQAWTEALLERLVALNSRRAAEEAQGTIRWLRPTFQSPSAAATTPQQTEIDTPVQEEADDAESAGTTAAATAITKQPWPTTLPEQMKAVADALTAAPGVLTEAALSERFSGRGPWKKRLPQILETLKAVGRAQAVEDGGWRRAG